MFNGSMVHTVLSNKYRQTKKIVKSTLHFFQKSSQFSLINSSSRLSFITGMGSDVRVGLPFFKRIFEKIPVIFFGEEHDLALTREFLWKYMRQLKACGVTHLAVELPVSFQDQVDMFFDTNEDKHILSIFNHETKGGLHHAKSFLKLFRTAKENGIQVRLMDEPTWLRRYPSGNLRDQNMAAKIENILKEAPSAKIIALVGQYHAHRAAIPDRLRDGFSIESVSIGILPREPMSRHRGLDGFIIPACLTMQQSFWQK